LICSIKSDFLIIIEGQSSTKTDVPTAEQILGKLLGVKPKPPDQTFAPQALATAPQTVPMINPLPQLPSTSRARSPYKSPLFSNSLPLIPLGARGATPQTEENQVPPLNAEGYSLPPPPNGYHYGRPRRKRPRYEDDELRQDDGAPPEEDQEEEEENPADEEYHDQRNLLGGGRRGRGRNLQCQNRIKGDGTFPN